MLDQKRIGEKLRKYRKDLGLTQQEVAEKANVSAQAVSKWESGESMPDIFNLKSISDIYNISLDELLETKSDTTFKKDIKNFEYRLKKLEKAISIIGAPNIQAQFKKMLEGSKCFYDYDFTKLNGTFAPWVLESATVTNMEGDLSFSSIASPIKYRTYYDPMLESPDFLLDSSKAKYVHVWFKSKPENQFGKVKMNIYFRTNFDNVLDESKVNSSMYLPNEKGNYYCADFSQYGKYCGTITGFRFDILECAGQIDVSRILITETSDPNSTAYFEADFTQENGFEKSNFFVINGDVLSTDGVVSYKATELDEIHYAHDQRLINNEICLDIDNLNLRYVHVRYKVVAKRTQNAISQIYFKTRSDNNYTQSKSVRVAVTNGGMNDVYFDMKTNPAWQGTLTGLRADLLECEGDMTIELVEVLMETPETAIGGWVRSVEERLGKGGSFNFNSSIEDYLETYVEDYVESYVEDFLDDSVEYAIRDAVEAAFEKKSRHKR